LLPPASSQQGDTYFLVSNEVYSPSLMKKKKKTNPPKPTHLYDEDTELGTISPGDFTEQQKQ